MILPLSHFAWWFRVMQDDVGFVYQNVRSVHESDLAVQILG